MLLHCSFANAHRLQPQTGAHLTQRRRQIDVVRKHRIRITRKQLLTEEIHQITRAAQHQQHAEKARKPSAANHKAWALQKVRFGGGNKTENIVLHEVPRREAGGWSFARAAAGYSIYPELFSQLWLIEHIGPPPETAGDRS